MLLEQWSAQLGLEDAYSAEDAMAIDVNVGQERSPSPVPSHDTPQAGMSMTLSPPLSGTFPGTGMLASNEHTNMPSSGQSPDHHFNQHQHHHQHKHDIPQTYPPFNRESPTHSAHMASTTSNNSRRNTPSTTHTGRSTADSVWAVRR